MENNKRNKYDRKTKKNRRKLYYEREGMAIRRIKKTTVRKMIRQEGKKDT